VADYPATARTVPTRLRERATYDTDTVHAILDEALVCHVATVVDGEPRLLPTLHARVEGTLLLHASVGGPLARAAVAAGDAGVPVCVGATLLDGLVLARSAFHHSVNYRSVVVHGRATVVAGDAERLAAMDAFVRHVLPGREDDVRRPTRKELAATAVLAVPLDEVSAKVRTGPPVDDDEDVALPHWAGVVPLRTTFGAPQPATYGGPRPLPGYVPEPGTWDRGSVPASR
jgi:nitroimidazol reductase NimA-like FMN-containing flavoprotein (pyridoxamine 5'-phosphate oxidase superfamily)